MTAAPIQDSVARSLRFTTQVINSCKTTARTRALVNNGWCWYCPPGNPKARLQATTSRPQLLAAWGRIAPSGGQTKIYQTSLHGKAILLKSLMDQHPSGIAARHGWCGGVQSCRPMGGAAALLELPDPANFRTVQAGILAPYNGESAGFTFSRFPLGFQPTAAAPSRARYLIRLG